MKGERARARGCLVALTLYCLTPLPCFAQTLIVAEPPEATEGVGHLKVELDREEITVGDRIQARLTLVWTGPEPADEPRFPIWRDAWGRAAVLVAGEVETSIYGARRVYRQTVEVTAFETGEISLPRISVTLPFGAEAVEIEGAGEASFEVKSVLPEDEQELEPRPAAPPRPLARGWRFAWTTGTGLGLSRLLLRPLGRPLPTAPGAAAQPPATQRVAELLQHLRRLEASAAEPAHTGLSRALRRFLGRSLRFPAAESTTSQIRRRLRASCLEPATACATVDLLCACDQVKFARVPVGSAVTRERLADARRLARDVDQALAPVEPAAEA